MRSWSSWLRRLLSTVGPTGVKGLKLQTLVVECSCEHYEIFDKTQLRLISQITV